MRKCDKCQIMIKDNESKCPICGKEIAGFNPSAAYPDTAEVPLHEMNEADFGKRIKNILQQSSFTAAVVFFAINIILNIIIGVADGVKWSYLISMVCMIIFAIPLVMMYADRNNRESNVKTLRAMKLFKILAGIQIGFVAVMIAAFLAGSVIMVLTGNTALIELFSIDIFAAMEGIVLSDQEKIMIMGASLFVGTIFAAAVSLPYAVSTFLLVSDTTTVLKGKQMKKLRGTAIYRLYNIIVLVFSIITAISVSGLFPGNAVLGLVSAAGMITSALPGYLLSKLATQFNNIVKAEYWYNFGKTTDLRK